MIKPQPIPAAKQATRKLNIASLTKVELEVKGIVSPWHRVSEMLCIGFPFPWKWQFENPFLEH
jgi:hypothetical protein